MIDITKEHLIELFGKGFRLDGRKFDEYRKINVEYGISSLLRFKIDDLLRRGFGQMKFFNG